MAVTRDNYNYNYYNLLLFKWRLKVRMFLRSQMSAGREFQVEQQQKKSEKIRKLHRFNNNIQVVIVLPVQENFFKKFEKLQIFKKC